MNKQQFVLLIGILCTSFSLQLVAGPDSDADEFSKLLQKAIAAFPKFDVAAAKKEAVKELDLKNVPENVPGGNKFNQVVSNKVKQLVEKKYSEKLRSKYVFKSMKKYKTIAIGESVTLYIRFGGKRVKYTGKFKGKIGKSVFIGDKKILDKDVDPDMLKRFKKGDMVYLQKKYVKKHFDHPKRKYYQQMNKKIRKEYKGKRDLYIKFKKAVDKRKELFPKIRRNACLQEALKNFLKKKMRVFDSIADEKKKIEKMSTVVKNIKKIMSDEKIDSGIDTELILDASEQYGRLKQQIIVLRSATQPVGSKTAFTGEKKISSKMLASIINKKYMPYQNQTVKKNWKQVYKEIDQGQYVIARNMLADMHIYDSVKQKTKPEIEKLMFKLNGADQVKNPMAYYETLSLNSLADYIEDYLMPGQMSAVENFYRYARDEINMKEFLIAKTMVRKAYKAADGECASALEVLYDKCGIQAKKMKQKDKFGKGKKGRKKSGNPFKM